MKLRSILLLLTVYVFTYNVTLNAQSDLQEKIPMNPKVVKKILPNGFTYYLQKNNNPENQLIVRLVIKAGSILETEQQRGMAHFLEHMVFNGSKHFPDNSLIDYMQSIGVEFGGDINAYTGYDETVYMLPLPNCAEETLDKTFLFLGDILNGLSLTTEAIDKERSIIHEEWRTTIGLNERLKNEMYPLLYRQSRYLNRLPIGLMDEVILKNGNDEELRKFWRSWYRPDLTSLIVVGNFDIDNIEKRICETFCPLELKKNAPKRDCFIVPLSDSSFVKIIKDKEITGTSINIVQKFPHKGEETLGDLKKSITNILYTYMINQRLSDVAQSINAPFIYAQSYASSSVGNIDRYNSIASLKSDSIIDGIKGLVRELLRIKRFGFTQAELDRKKLILSNDIERMAAEEDKLSSEQIMEAISNYVIYGEENADFSFKKRFTQQVIDELTVADIQTLIDEYIDQLDEGKIIFLMAPESSKTPSESEILNAIKAVSSEQLEPYIVNEINEPLMTEYPTGGILAKKSYSLKTGITTLELTNGVRVDLKPTTFKIDEIRFSSIRNGGYSLASDQDFNNATMAAVLVNNGGLGKFSKSELEQLISGKQVDVSPYIHSCTEGVTGFSSSSDFETLLQLTYLIYTSPRKDSYKFQQYIANKKEFNKNQLNDPDSFFADEINKIMMQNSLRTATLLTVDQLDSLNLDKAFDFYKSRFDSAYGTHFSIVGSFNPDSIQPLVIKYLGSLPGTKAASNFVDHGIRPPQGNHRYVFPHNSVDRSKVIIRFTGKYPVSQTKRIEMGLLTDVLTNQLNQKLREEIGGVYSPYASSNVFEYPYQRYQFDVVFTCSPNNVDTLVKATFGEIEKIKMGIEDNSIDKVKKAWLKNRDGSLKTNEFWRRTIEDMWIRDEDESDLLNYEEQIGRVTMKDLSRLAKKYLNKKNHLEFILSPES